MAENVLGIDFGTSFCTMCACNAETGKPEVIRDECGMDKIPSVVYWGPGGDVRVGQAAMDLLTDVGGMESERRTEVFGRIIRSVKRQFFPDRAIALPDGETVCPVEVAAAILKYLKRNAEERRFHGPVRSVTLTHPASFTQAQKTLLKEAGRRAGFEEICLLEEPVAAAMGYAASFGKEVGKGILVYDLGGGTLDLAFVARGGAGGFRVPVAPCGDAMCGGDDFDQALYDYAEADLISRHGVRFADGGAALDLPVRFLCRDLKERLSRSENGTLRHFLEDKGLAYTVTVSRTAFNGLIENRVAASVTQVKQLLQRVATDGHAVDTVILIGGSSRIPLVRTMLEAALPVKPLAVMLDDCAVAMGAALDALPTPIHTLQAGETTRVYLTGGVSLELVWCPSGVFLMGSPEIEVDRWDDETQHQITMAEGFWLGKYSITQQQWKAVMGWNPSCFKGDELPVESVTWKDCQKFINKLNTLVRDGGFRLPTETEWEYACRAGTGTPFHFGEQLRADMANFDGRSQSRGASECEYRERTIAVGQFKPNRWGLYDMHGNVWEWCQDWYVQDLRKGRRESEMQEGGIFRVIRGGSWYCCAKDCRSAFRSRVVPECRGRDIGLRLARDNAK